MNAAEVQEPPKKRRRFFVDASPPPEESPPPLPSASNSTLTSPEGHGLDDRPLHSSQTDPATHDYAESSRTASAAFDQATFESFIGEKIQPAVLQKLQQAAGDNMERAINMYFDGSWSAVVLSPQKPQRTPAGSTIKDAFAPPATPQLTTKRPEKATPEPKTQAQCVAQMPEYRYVGAFGVGAWATRSGSGLISISDQVKVERTKIKPPVKMGRGGKPVVPSRGNVSRQRGDIIVRITNSRGEEIGRLPKNTASWVSTLIDQRICHFDGVCFFAPDRLKVNDTIELQLRCSLLRRAFEASAFRRPSDDNRTTGIFEEQETSEEKDLRLRQVALVKLFDEIRLQPTTVNDLTAQHKRQGILEAAEVAEKYEKDNEEKKPSGTQNGASTPPDDEEEEGKELEQDQLDSLYKKAQSFDFDTPIREPADTFVMSLRKYQKQALHWMMSKERDEKVDDKEVSMHPLWEQYSWPKKDVDEQPLMTVSDQDDFYVNPYSGEMSLIFPAQEQHCLGGILADEMGLGKTIEMLSLIHTNRSDAAIKLAETGAMSIKDLPRLPKTSSAAVFAPCTTLVVAPMSLLAQWESEAEKASKPGSLKTLLYYGSDKAANLRNLCCEANAASAPNLIITSYGIVLSEFNQVASRGGDRGSHGGLFSLEYYRIILDEAHFIKNRQSKTAKACYGIDARHRWVLTGTPIVNRLEDLFSMVHFLRVEPWSNFSFWKTFITVPFESKDFIRALDVVQTVLEPLVIRRTKDMKTPDGEALVPLPPKTIDIEEVELSKQEREVYDFIYTRAKRAFNATMEAGTLLKSYTTIFAQILRLRQSCCHPVLTRNKEILAEEEEAHAASDVANGLADDMDLQELIERFTSDADTSGDLDIANRYGANVLQEVQAQEDKECPICSEEPMISPAVTGCWHIACKDCLLNYIEHQKNKHEVPLCFNCRAPINQRDIFEVVHHDPSDESDPEASQKTTLRRIGLNSSAKIAALTTHLLSLRKTNPGTKTVVFSQFTSFLDIIAPAFTAQSIPFLRFDGSMAQKQRALVLTQFSDAAAAKNGSGVVLLLSLRAGGVGLNLTAAKRVYMMDPWWSFAVEAQAIDRVHRMGQEEEVKVVRFIVKGSIEGRMLRVQDRKKFIASSLGMMSEEEKKLQRIEDIKELLS